MIRKLILCFLSAQIVDSHQIRNKVNTTQLAEVNKIFSCRYTGLAPIDRAYAPHQHRLYYNFRVNYFFSFSVLWCLRIICKIVV